MTIYPVSLQGAQYSGDTRSKENNATFAPNPLPHRNETEAVEQSLDALANLAKGAMNAAKKIRTDCEDIIGSVEKVKVDHNLSDIVKNSKNIDVAMFEQVGKFEKVNDLERGKATIDGKPFNGTIYDGGTACVYKNGKLVEETGYNMYPNFYNPNGELIKNDAINKAEATIVKNNDSQYVMLIPKANLMVSCNGDKSTVSDIVGGNTYVGPFCENDFVKSYLEDINPEYSEAFEEYINTCKMIDGNE